MKLKIAKAKTAKLGTLAILFAFLLVMLFYLHPFGKPDNTKMDDYFIQNSQEETGSNNVVASVLFDYRGMDTLGEATVLFAAACGVFIIFLKRENEKRK